MSIELRRLHSHLHTLVEDLDRRERPGRGWTTGAVAAVGAHEADPWEVATVALPVGARTLTWADLEAELDSQPNEVAEPALEDVAEILLAAL